MRERDIRNSLLEELVTRHRGEDAIIINEFGLCQGKARIDLAVINGMLNGYEIKSPQDTLERLPVQAAFYSRVFDTVTIVVSEPHVSKVELVIPEWWGIVQAVGHDGKVHFVSLRPAQPNPMTDAYALVQLLWRDEMLSILQSLGRHRGLLSKPRHVLAEALVNSLDHKELRRQVLTALKCRSNWRSDLRRT